MQGTSSGSESPTDDPYEKERTTLTCARAFKRIWPGPVACDILAERDAGVELLSEDVAFVEEQDDVRLGEELVRHDRLPQVDAVLDPVHVDVFLECLVEARDRREEDDRVDHVEVRRPEQTL